ncbi:MAG: lipoyl(octanoyl) transferase LipB [Actinobacteria bacterium]|nr:lipoyl(octanoyl) transferase LipB [Actinomycetota bacterium]
MNINVVRLGLTDYKQALEIQEKLQLLRQQEKIEDVLILLEHPPVLTLGRSGNYSDILLLPQDLKARGIEVFEVSRGGNVTYHGPGQIVGYIIMDLNKQGRDINQFVWKISEVFIRLLKEKYDIDAARERGKYTGVWIGNEKITAIGISVKRWVTMHGFAFNVNTQMQHFKLINPCGLKDRGVTSLEKITGAAQDFNKLNELVLEYFCKVFNLKPSITDISKIIS